MAKKIQDVSSFYDKETAKYLSDRYQGDNCEHFSYNSRKEIVVDMLQGLSGSILDVGCGPAIYTEKLLDMGLVPVSVDLSLEMLLEARESLRKKQRDLQWVRAEIDHLPFINGAFDNVMAIGVIAYSEDPVSALAELYRVLNSKGILVVQCTNAISPARAIYNLKDQVLYKVGIRKRPYEFRMNSFNFNRLKRLLEREGFIVLEKRYYDFRVPFLDRVSTKAAVALMEMFHRLFSKSHFFGWLGQGYIIKTVKV